MSHIARRSVNHSYGGVSMSGEFAVDEAISGLRPGILVVHEAFGLGDHVTSIAERLAGMGYAALAMDLWGERAQITEMGEVMETIGTMTSDPATWMGRVRAALEALAAQDEVDSTKLAATGYCFGGATVLEFARTGGAVRGVASFHGALNPLGSDWTSDAITAKLLVCTGRDDPLVPAEAVETFQTNLAGTDVDYEIDIYSGTKHSFTNVDADVADLPDMIAYNAQSDQRSWARLNHFLTEIFA